MIWTDQCKPLAVMAALTGSMAFALPAVASPIEPDFIDLGGPATGYLAVSNIKNSSTQNGIEGKDSSGNFNPFHNGLPDYPNFLVPAGFTNEGVYTAIITSPPSASHDYTEFFNTFYSTASTTPTVNNQVVTQPGADSFSAGRIDYDNSLVSPTGTSTIGVGDLSLDFNTFEWDGNINGDGGATGLPTPGANADSPWVVPGGPFMISPFSPIYTIYNDSNGAGNAAIFYEISVTNLTGSGLTFVDGELVSMDITGDLIVGLKLGQAIAFPAVLFGEGEDSFAPGTFIASGLGYEFSLQDTETAAFFSGINMYFNRAGTASVVPEPTSVLLMGAGGLLLLGRVRRRSSNM